MQRLWGVTDSRDQRAMESTPNRALATSADVWARPPIRPTKMGGLMPPIAYPLSHYITGNMTSAHKFQSTCSLGTRLREMGKRVTFTM